MPFTDHRSKAAEAWRTPPEPTAGMSVRAIVPWMAAAILVYLAVAVLLAPSGEPEKYFVEEPGLVNALSAILLAIAGGFFVVLYSGQATGRAKLFWGLLSVGFLFFALDELVQGHEKLGGKLDSVLGGAGGFRNMGDVIVIAYGLVALACLPTSCLNSCVTVSLRSWRRWGLFCMRLRLESIRS